MKRVEVPGMGIVEFPDEMSDAQIEGAISRNMAADRISLPPVMERFRDLAAGLVRGTGSIGATLMTPIDLATGATTSIGNPERRKAMDEALRALGADTQSMTYQAGKLLPEVAGTMGAGGLLGRGLAAVAPKAAPMIDALTTAGFRAGGATGLPGIAARTAGGAIAGGASAGLVNPEDAAFGAKVGGALPGVAIAARGVGQGVGALLRPDSAKADLARTAMQRYGIPLGLSDVTDNAIIRGARSALDDVPVIGGIGKSRQQAAQEAFNRAVGETFGAQASSLTPGVVDASKKRIGSALDAVWGRNSLKLDGQYITQLQKIQNDAMSKLNPEQAAQVDRTIQNLLQKASGAEIPGSAVNNWQSELRMVTESEKGLHKKLLADLRRATLDAFNRSVPSEDAKKLGQALGQYKAFKTVQPLLEKGEVGTAGRSVGDVPAALLPEAVRAQYSGNIAGSPFADLSQIGSQFLADRVARTGGSARAGVQNLALGAGLGVGAGWNPMVPLLGIPAMAGAESLLSSPAAARTLLGIGGPGLLSNPSLFRAAPVLLNADQ